MAKVRLNNKYRARLKRHIHMLDIDKTEVYESLKKIYELIKEDWIEQYNQEDMEVLKKYEFAKIPCKLLIQDKNSIGDSEYIDSLWDEDNLPNNIPLLVTTERYIPIISIDNYETFEELYSPIRQYKEDLAEMSRNMEALINNAKYIDDIVDIIPDAYAVCDKSMGSFNSELEDIKDNLKNINITPKKNKSNLC